ncbi:vascular endothelial growth factor receptor 3-like [Zophobas morio]|uniref:vascular endothelial growth factor receptor 3-like n=1 Tax=Zophobas morio TaxID=2755281 RepID=UPI0030828925
MGSIPLFCISFFFLTFSLFVLSLGHEKPEIFSEYAETNLETGDNFTVLCQGQTPLKWKWPLAENEEYQNWTRISEIEVLPKNANYKYARKLVIQNITYPYTGFYQCLDKNADSFDENHGSSIYLFVKDKEHLSVSDAQVETITVTQYSEAIIPCRPTASDVEVSLTSIGGQITLGEIDEDGIMYRYDPHYGIITNNTKDIGGIIFLCYFSQDSKKFSRTMILDVEKINHFLPKPSMKEITGGHTIVGDKLILECRIRSETYVNIVWTTPTGPPDSTRMRLSSQKKIPEQTILTQNFIINETTLRDKGMYYCNVSDNQNHASLGSLNVRVYAPTEHFINLTEDNNVYTISAKAGDDAVVWRINVDGHPVPRFWWLNNRNEIIMALKSDKYDVTSSATDTVIKIKDISITDHGNYTLVAENGFEIATMSLFLNVTDKPQVHLEGNTHHMVDEKDTIKCTCYCKHASVGSLNCTLYTPTESNNSPISTTAGDPKIDP